MDDCARSTKRNIEEGWKRPTTAEYLQFIGYSQASLEELAGGCYDAKTDGFLTSRPGSNLLDIGINVRVLKGPTRTTNPYPPLTQTLTYEMFKELTNKTDWLLRKLAESLEAKLVTDRKGHKILQARTKDAIAPKP